MYFMYVNYFLCTVGIIQCVHYTLVENAGVAATRVEVLPLVNTTQCTMSRIAVVLQRLVISKLSTGTVLKVSCSMLCITVVLQRLVNSTLSTGTVLKISIDEAP